MIYGKAARLSDQECRRDDGMIKEQVAITITEKMLASIVDITWGKQVSNAINPRVRMRIDPRRLMVDLVVNEIDPYEALEWRTREFNLTLFRENVERGLMMALAHWGRREFDVVIWADGSGIRKTTEKDGSIGVHAVSR